MRALVLAAGSGERLRPLTNDIPKPMISIGGKPILQRNIELLTAAGVKEIAINLHHLPNIISDYFGDGHLYGAKIQYVRETDLLGTAGALRNCSSFFSSAPFLVVYGDNLSTIDLTRLISFHRGRGGDATIAVFQRPDPSASGIVSFEEGGRISRFKEKPTENELFSNWVNAGYYVLEPSVLDFIPKAGPSDFGRDVFPKMLDNGARLFAYTMKERLWWIDSPADYDRVRIEFSRA